MNFRVQDGLKQLGLVVAYVLIAKFVVMQFGSHGALNFLWLACGLALAVLLEGGYRYLPAIFVGAFLGNWLADASINLSLHNAVRHTLAAFVAIGLLKKEGRFDKNFAAVSDYFRVIFLAFATGLFIAIFAEMQKQILSPTLVAEINARGFYQRFAGNALGAIVVMPLLLIWRRFPQEWLTSRAAFEAALILGLSFLVGQVVFVGWLPDTLGLVARGYWMFLFITWAAVRLGAHGAMLILVASAVQGLAGAHLGVGFFSNDIARTSLANYFFYMLCLATVGMLLAIYMNARKRTEEELRRYKDHLEEEVQTRTAELMLARDAAETASRAKSVFLASMSHELRTPLNAILGFSGLLRYEAGLSPEQRQTLDLINRSGEHLLNLINDVLDMAKIEAGRLNVENAPFDLGQMTRDVVDLMRVRAEEKGLEVLLDQTSEFPRMVRGDLAKLRQSLINLVGNAIKFTAQGSVTLRLNARPADTPQRLWLVIEVQDTGAGIAAEDQERVFKPFIQASQGGQQSLQKGTGLGLTITRQYVELMGGSLSLISAPGQGSCFRIELPVERADEAEIEALQIDRARVVGLAPGQPDYRILIVEDQIENWLLLRRLLEGVGFMVRVAENGQIGIEMFQSWRPDFIWMDLRMPVLDGLEAGRRIRTLEGGGEVKIAALTASAFKEERDQVMAAGMDDFVRKPFRPQEIFDCLTRNLGIRFIREEGAAEALAQLDTALKPQALASLPQALRQELCDALVCLDNERITEGVRRIAELDPALGDALAHHASRLDYTAMLHFLKAGSGNSTEKIAS